MMDDVCNLNWRFRPLLDKNLATDTMIRKKDQSQHPKAYVTETIIVSNT